MSASRAAPEAGFWRRSHDLRTSTTFAGAVFCYYLPSYELIFPYMNEDTPRYLHDATCRRKIRTRSSSILLAPTLLITAAGLNKGFPIRRPSQ